MQLFKEDEFFKEITLRICSSLSAETALERAYAYLQKVLRLDELIFVTLDREIGGMRKIAYVVKGKALTYKPVVPLSKDLWNWVAHLSGAFLVNPDIDPRVKEIAPLVGIDPANTSDLVLSLEADGNRIGHLLLRAYCKDSYTTEQVELLLSVREPFALALANALSHEETLKYKDLLLDDNKFLKNEIFSNIKEEMDNAVSGYKGLQRVAAQIKQVAPFNNTVLLLGETGTGKEVIANKIHFSSPRSKGPFIKVNCGAIPDNLIDSELFGYEKGAFTGATHSQRGRFERASGGTIFLDEIGELPLQAQTRLLRVLQNREVERIGGQTPFPVDIRVIAATNRDLNEMVKEKLFREDLWFRLNVFPIIIPPLRERKEDIPALVRFFVKQKQKELGIVTPPIIAPGALEKLMKYSWPGNVRELENLIESELIRNRQNSSITFDTIYCYENLGLSNEDEILEILNLDDIISRHIIKILELSKGKIHGAGGAAELLGINPNTLRSRMRKLGISFKNR